jgi:hypothetical protein
MAASVFLVTISRRQGEKRTHMGLLTTDDRMFAQNVKSLLEMGGFSIVTRRLPFADAADPRIPDAAVLR